MNHDNNICASGQCEPVTRLLIRAVTAIFRMNLNLDAIKLAGDCHCIVVAGVVDDDHEIDNPLGHHFVVGALQSARGVISGHYHHNFLAV